jgi:disulfide bond formation protein DsbB
MTRRAPYLVLALAVLALVLVPIGSAVFVLGFVHGDSPCVLCWAQRTGMTLVALMGLFVLRYGPRPRYLGLAVLIAAHGLYMGLRHSAGHVVRDVGQGFSLEILGAHTYIWSIAIFWIGLVAVGALILLLRDGEATRTLRRPGRLERLAMYAFLVVVAGNIVQAFASTGPPPFMGQADPVRFSWNPRHWVWSTEEWSPAPISLRGRWTIEKPDAGAAAAVSAPLPGAALLPVERTLRLALPLEGAITDIAHEPGRDRFLLTTARGVYVVDGGLSRVERYTLLDAGFSVDLGELAGAAFLDRSTMMALSQNKSFVVLREAERADPARNFRFFVESFDAFDEVARSRFATVRAKMMYVLSLAFDPGRNALYTVTVPNARVRQLVVSRFDRGDLTLSEEFVPLVEVHAPGAGASPGPPLTELYVTGATFSGDRLYAISAAHRALLAIDPVSHRLTVVGTVPVEGTPTGICARGEELYLVSAEGTVSVIRRPGA